MRVILQAIKRMFRKVWRELAKLDTKVSGVRTIAETRPDWAENDPESHSYIKNRSFYELLEIDSLLLDEVAFTVSDSTYVLIKAEALAGMEIGETYIVILDGIPYTTEPAYDGEGPIRADVNAEGIIFFRLDFDPYINKFFISTLGKITSGTHTIKIASGRYEKKKIDDMFMPDSVNKALETAQTTAETAQTTAETAQTTAETAQTTAETAQTAIRKKLDNINPEATGSFSLNRTGDTGAYSCAVGLSIFAQYPSSFAAGAYNVEDVAGNYVIASGPGMVTTIQSNGYYSDKIIKNEDGSYSLIDPKNYTSAAKPPIGSFILSESNASLGGAVTTGANAYRIISYTNDAIGIHAALYPVYTTGKYVFCIGNGADYIRRSNAHTLDWNGVAWFQGRPQFGGNAQDDGSQTVMANGDTEIILKSSTTDSTKQFKITVDDSGTLTATEVTS